MQLSSYLLEGRASSGGGWSLKCCVLHQSVWPRLQTLTHAELSAVNILSLINVGLFWWGAGGGWLRGPLLAVGSTFTTRHKN